VNLVNAEVAATSTWCIWSCYIFVWLNCISIYTFIHSGPQLLPGKNSTQVAVWYFQGF